MSERLQTVHVHTAQGHRAGLTVQPEGIAAKGGMAVDIYATAVIPYDGETLICDFPIQEMSPLNEKADKNQIFSVDEILQ